MEYTAALIVSIFCIAVGLSGLSLEKDQQQRTFLFRLFLSAFVVRLLFTLVFYTTGLVHILGGADDTIWLAMWSRSRFWETSGPDPVWTIFDPNTIQSNLGWNYFGSYFYYLLNIKSQLALACLNGFANSLVVIVIYRAARTFFNDKTCVFVAWVAVFMPSFLIWSALTVKESWLILFEISIFYVVWQASRQKNPVSALFYGLIVAVLIGVVASFRFYAAAFLVAGIVISILCVRSHRPAVSAGYGSLAIALLYFGFNAVGVIQFDLTNLTQTRLNELNSFRSNISDSNQLGTGSAVVFDFDTSTPQGASLMLAAGSIYLLLSPFPWQIRSFSQVATLPDVLLWWWLVFVFIVPGIIYVWRRQPALLLSIVAFALPMFLFYAFMFGNVGLAYRQRAQLMPFLLILAAAGYEKRQQEKNKKQVSTRFLQSRSQLPTGTGYGTSTREVSSLNN